MSKIKEFSKTNLNSVRRDIDIALASVEKEYGITLKLGNIRFSGTSFTTKVSADVKPTNGKSLGETKFNANCVLYGLKKSDFGKTFTEGRKTYTITGINTRSKRYPIECQCLTNGKGIRFTASLIREILNR